MQRQAAGGRSPEELVTQLEDAFIVRDAGVLADLFDERAALSPPDSDVDMRGGEQIASFAAAHWEADHRYLAEVRRVVQAGDMAAVVVDWSLTAHATAGGTNHHGRGVDVLRRGSDGAWRYLISLLRVCEPPKGDG